MLRYGRAFVRSLILVWLATWLLADPLFLLQGLMAPEKYSAARRVIRNGPAGEHHFAAHYSDFRAKTPSPTSSDPATA